MNHAMRPPVKKVTVPTGGLKMAKTETFFHFTRHHTYSHPSPINTRINIIAIHNLFQYTYSHIHNNMGVIKWGGGGKYFKKYLKWGGGGDKSKGRENLKIAIKWGGGGGGVEIKLVGGGRVRVVMIFYLLQV